MSTHVVQHPVVASGVGVHVTGRRVVSTLVDGLIVGGFYNLLVAMFGDIGHPGSWYWEGSMTNTAANIFYGIAVVAYFILMEAYLGQALGKMIAGIKVVREDSAGVPGLGAATIRTVLRIVDGLFGYLVAFIAVLSTEKRQRLGDMAAHTLVVRK